MLLWPARMVGFMVCLWLGGRSHKTINTANAFLHTNLRVVQWCSTERRFDRCECFTEFCACGARVSVLMTEIMKLRTRKMSELKMLRNCRDLWEFAG